MNLDNGLGDIGLPLKETGRSAQSRRALEKDDLGASIGGEDIDELSQERLGRERAAVDDSCHHITGFDRAAISIAKSNEILHGSDAEQKQGTSIQIGFAGEGPEGYGPDWAGQRAYLLPDGSSILDGDFKTSVSTAMPAAQTGLQIIDERGRAIVKKRLAIKASLYEMLQILSLTLFEKNQLLQLFTRIPPQISHQDTANRLNLFD